MHPLAKKAFSLQAAGKLEASQETFAALLAEQPMTLFPTTTMHLAWIG